MSKRSSADASDDDSSTKVSKTQKIFKSEFTTEPNDVEEYVLTVTDKGLRRYFLLLYI